MSSITSGISIYPSGFDLNASGATMVYVADEVRDPFTGNVVTSGSEILGVQINTAYTAINNIEQTLGLNPQGDFSTVADRILSFETISGSNAYVKKIGDVMTGNLSLISGAAISLVNVISSSGVNWSGTGTFNLSNNGNILFSGQTIQFTASGATTINAGQQLSIKTGSGAATSLVITSGSSIFYGNILPSGSINIGAPTNPINTLYVTNFSGAGAATLGSGTYLPLAGGLLSGNTTLSGASLLTAISGTGTVGEYGMPFSGIYAKTGYFTNISGLSPITMLSEVVLSSGVYPLTSGVGSLGTPSNAFDSVIANSIFTNAVILSGSTLSPATLVQTSGSTMTGNLILASGATIVNAVSGVNDLGSQANPFANVWASSINGRNSVRFKFNELLNPAASGVYTFASAPSGATVIDVATIAGVTGISRFLVPTTHYTISGDTLTLSGVYTASGSLYSPFYVY
jgi:hypothetical protein